MALAYGVVTILILGLSFMCYWKGNPVIFMVTAGISIMTGLYSPDALIELNYSQFGVGVGLMLIAYSFVCIALAYANLFRGDTE